jgi:hypothetical protein
MNDGRLALLIGLTVVGVLALGLLPTILQEGTRDWIAYEQAADRLTNGEPLYVFSLATPDDEYYLYPPLMAALWALAGTPERLLVLKLFVLALTGALALVIVPATRPRARAIVAACLVVIAFVAPPNIHDLILSNVTTLYVGAVALSLARPGWLGAMPLGFVCAAALKPVIGPYLIWMLIRRRGDAGRVILVGIVASAICAIAIGPGRYVEYLFALPQMSVLANLPSGNVGLSKLSSELALVGLAVAYLATIGSALRGQSMWRSAAVAVAAGLLAQPALGFNYAGLLLPAVVALWIADRPAGLVASALVPTIAVISPPLAAAFVIVAGNRDLVRRFRSAPGAAAATEPTS